MNRDFLYASPTDVQGMHGTTVFRTFDVGARTGRCATSGPSRVPRTYARPVVTLQPALGGGRAAEVLAVELLVVRPGAGEVPQPSRLVCSPSCEGLEADVGGHEDPSVSPAPPSWPEDPRRVALEADMPNCRPYE